MASPNKRARFVVLDAHKLYFRHFDTLADGERELKISPKVLKKILEGDPVTHAKALKVAKVLWNKDRSVSDEPLDLVKQHVS